MSWMNWVDHPLFSRYKSPAKVLIQKEKVHIVQGGIWDEAAVDSVTYPCTECDDTASNVLFRF